MWEIYLLHEVIVSYLSEAPRNSEHQIFVPLCFPHCSFPWEILLISYRIIWNSLGVKGVLSIIVTFYLTSSFPCKSCYGYNKIRRGISDLFLIFLWWGKVAEQIYWAAGMAKVTLTLKKKVLTSTYPKIWIILGCLQFWNPFLQAVRFLPFFSPHWFLTFPFFLIDPIPCGCFNFTCSNTKQFLWYKTLGQFYQVIMCLVSSGKKKSLLPRFHIIAWILWFSYLVGSANPIPKVHWLQRWKGIHYMLPAEMVTCK